MNKNKVLCAVLVGALTIPMAASTTIAATSRQETSRADVYATQASSYSMTIPKTIILDGQNGTGAFSVSVTGNIGGEEKITITPDATFLMNQDGKPSIDTTVEQLKTEFVYDDLKSGTECVTTGSVTMASISAGSWNGTFNFNVTCEVDDTMTDSVASVAEDITNATKVGQDAYQSQESAYTGFTSADGTAPISVNSVSGIAIDANVDADANATVNQ